MELGLIEILLCASAIACIFVRVVWHDGDKTTINCRDVQIFGFYHDVEETVDVLHKNKSQKEITTFKTDIEMSEALHEEQYGQKKLQKKPRRD